MGYRLMGSQERERIQVTEDELNEFRALYGIGKEMPYHVERLIREVRLLTHETKQKSDLCDALRQTIERLNKSLHMVEMDLSRCRDENDRLTALLEETEQGK